jgi:hypothetical protein
MVTLKTIGQNQNLARLNAGLSSNSSCALGSSDVFVKNDREEEVPGISISIVITCILILFF